MTTWRVVLSNGESYSIPGRTQHTVRVAEGRWLPDGVYIVSVSLDR